eukprot:scaffold282715_cov15-Tisochrysis_lutea.AAC.2
MNPGPTSQSRTPKLEVSSCTKPGMTPLAFGWSALKELAKVPQHEQKSYSFTLASAMHCPMHCPSFTIFCSLIDASVFKLGLHDPSRADKLPPGLTAIQVKGRIQKQLHIGLTKGYPLQHVQIVDPFKEKRDVRMQLSGDNL